MTADDPLVWPIEGREDGHDYGIFRTRFVRARHPGTGEGRRFVALDCADWVNVIAFTPDDHIVLLRQYRLGAEKVCLEIPGGLVDPGESAADAAVRELREETGYQARSWHRLGEVRPNPAIQGNRLTTFVALDATPSASAEPDDGEVLAVETAALAEVEAMLRDGRIDHALVAVAFGQLLFAAGGRLARPRF
jgi:ADP-ribose pyrophosphatase